MQEVVAGKKTVQRPQEIVLPAAVKRTAGVASNFLWDNSAYLLGIDQKGKPRAQPRVFSSGDAAAPRDSGRCGEPRRAGDSRFFRHMGSVDGGGAPALRASFDEITGSANLAFRVDGVYPQDDPAIRAAWPDASRRRRPRTPCACSVL